MIQLTVAWLNLIMPNQTVKNSLKAKAIKLPQMNFFLKKQLMKFSCTYWLPSSCKIFKKLLKLIQGYEMCHFRIQNSPFVINKKFLLKIIIIAFIYLTDPFHCAKFLKNLTAHPELWPFLGPKWPICLKQIFAWKIINITLILTISPFHWAKFQK